MNWDPGLGGITVKVGSRFGWNPSPKSGIPIDQHTDSGGNALNIKTSQEIGTYLCFSTACDISIYRTVRASCSVCFCSVGPDESHTSSHVLKCKWNERLLGVVYSADRWLMTWPGKLELHGNLFPHKVCLVRKLFMTPISVWVYLESVPCVIYAFHVWFCFCRH
jgi:hypothetical protein